LKNLQTSKLVDDTISVPADDKAIFALDGATLRFPDFERAEQLIEKLFATGQLSFTQPQYIPTQPRRTRSRQIKDLTGISPYKLRQLQRIHRALRLLKQGSTTADVIAELAFTDQAHLTHVSKHLLGYTPKHLKDLLQNP
jgi:methylphosphotriester-DNA--protein-cysteine methyltransferase